ncbi:MAG: hypothetical protein EOP36_08120 [Rubrivivax sp.]|nr:MAG: hypothetical protein EOP36_08120 [Rubrivivax sp.]
MNPRGLTPIALSAMLACLSLEASAQSTCPTSVTTIDLTSTASKPLTQVDINNKIKSATGKTVINLRGTFKISAEISIPVGINCLTLQTPALVTPAVLQWDAASPSTDVMIFAKGNHDIALRNIFLNGRNVMLMASPGGAANFTLDWVRFVNPTAGKLASDGHNAILRLVPSIGETSTKGWTITNSIFSTTPGLDAPYMNTAIMGYYADGVNISNNTFTNVDEGIHFQGLRNATLNTNKGTGLRRSAIEIQEGFSADYTTTIYKNNTLTLSGNSFTNWRQSSPNVVNDVVLGFSLANATGLTVTNNKLLYLGSDLASCQSTATTAAPIERWGMEFTAINSKATGNTICGFDWGIRMGFLGSASTYTGTDTTLIDNNTLANLYFSGIDMFGVGGPNDATDPATGTFYFTETPAQAKARWASILETPTRILTITNNTISNARIAAINDGGTFVGDGSIPTKMPDGSMQNFPRLPDSAMSHLAGLTIQGNKISRAHGFFPTDVTPTAAPWNDQRFTGLIVPAIRNAAQLKVNTNTISLSASPAAPNGIGPFVFKGIAANMMFSVDNGQFYDLAKTFNGSVLSGNIISASPNAYGTGLTTYDIGLNSWQGISVTANKLTLLAKGIESQAGTWARPGVTGNTCTNVLVPGAGC